MRLWGLTGGIASGKSTVRRLLAGHGAACVDADALYHGLLQPGADGAAPLARKIAAAFGSGLLGADGHLDRRALGQRVFAEPAARRQLEALTHPAVRQAAAQAFAKLAADGHRQAFYDVPLLFETGLERQLDGVIVVWVPAAVQRQRLMARDGVDAATADRRLQAQLSLDTKRQRATFVIDNSGPPEHTAAQVAALWQRLLGAAT